MSIKFGTKAETLERLRQKIISARIKPLKIFTVADWIKDSELVVRSIQKEFVCKSVIVRSSVLNEDSEHSSRAGEFLSVANVALDSASLQEAISKVISAYDDNNDGNQFFVQEMLLDVKMSGVVFTREADTFAPYYIINYDKESGSCDSVTSGKESQLETYIYHKSESYPPSEYDLKQVIEAAKELEGLLNNDALDIEFAIDRDQQIYVLQARPLVAKDSKQDLNEKSLLKALNKIKQKIIDLNPPPPGIAGSRNLYSVMTDWNPAEIIGIKPSALALSLYRELITDSTWAYQRNNYGYKNLRSVPLLVSFCGCPYIDVRASFNSFVPKDLDAKLTNKLVEYYIDCLSASPAEHDKVEFNIIFSCYFLNLPHKLKKLLNFGFTELELDRIKFALLSLTNNIISQKRGLYLNDLQRIEVLNRRYNEVCNSSMSITNKIYWLFEDCKRYGTLPFAGLARAGFIAVQFLKSFIDLGIINASEYDAYMNSLNTVAKQLSTDSQLMTSGKMEKQIFLEKYGHLRPGSYDIMSPRYDEAFELYFKEKTQHHAEAQSATFEFSTEQIESINEKLIANGIHADAKEILQFIKEAIEGREYSKFIFTRSLSKILLLVEELGRENGFTREQMSNVNINLINSQYAESTFSDFKELLAEEIEKNIKDAQVRKSIRLPQLIKSPENVFHFHLDQTEPNFVTLSRITSIVVLEEDFSTADLKDKIVFVRSADPGYDWIFSRKIGGLVTMYGGANSHMAIRCSELQIPAVIGCGEKNFKQWSESKMIELDCTNRKVRILSSADKVI